MLRPCLFNTIFAFPPNRDTLGGTAYFIVEKVGNILIDCPAWNEQNQEFIHEKGGVSWLFLTHRGGMGKVQEISQALGCQVLVQEQEAYLLPGLEAIAFEKEFDLSPTMQAIWTPGHTPGSSCLYYQGTEGVLFSGRHLLPTPGGDLAPIWTAKTFHWWRQLQSVETLRRRFPNLPYICPGANTGFLRGKRVIDRADERLALLDLAGLKRSRSPI